MQACGFDPKQIFGYIIIIRSPEIRWFWEDSLYQPSFQWVKAVRSLWPTNKSRIEPTAMVGQGWKDNQIQCQIRWTTGWTPKPTNVAILCWKMHSRGLSGSQFESQMEHGHLRFWSYGLAEANRLFMPFTMKLFLLKRKQLKKPKSSNRPCHLCKSHRPISAMLLFCENSFCVVSNPFPLRITPPWNGNSVVGDLHLWESVGWDARIIL